MEISSKISLTQLRVLFIEAEETKKRYLNFKEAPNKEKLFNEVVFFYFRDEGSR